MKKLKPFDLNEIQVCSICGKVDVYLNDGHDCAGYAQKKASEKP